MRTARTMDLAYFLEMVDLRTFSPKSETPMNAAQRAKEVTSREYSNGRAKIASID